MPSGFFPSSTVQLKRTTGLIPKCGSCGLYKTCKSPKMKPHGKGLQNILVLGEAPGQTEDELGRPFIGKAGKFLRDTLKSIGYDLDRDAVTTNALICRPQNNAAPEPKQIDYCLPNLTKTIQEVQPKVIVTLGRWALAAVMKEHWTGDIGTMERWAGWKIPLKDYWLCPTYHPSFLIRRENTLLDRQFSNDLEAAFGMENAPPEPPSPKVDILYDEREIYQAIREMDSQGGWAAVDYETNCLKPEYQKARLVSCAIANKDRTISYPWHGKAIIATGMFLKSGRTKKISSNLKMEERWTLKEFGHGVANWGWDTMLAAHALDNRPGICSLKFQALVQMGVPSYNESIAPYLESSNGHYNRIGDIDLKSLLLYGGLDAAFELKLAMIQRKDMGYL